MRFYFVRHGEMAGDPFAEPERPVSGCLSERGIRQALRVRGYLMDKHPDAAYSSPFGRALQTAEIALPPSSNVPIHILHGIHEWMPNPALEKLPSTEYESILQRNSGMEPDAEWKTELGEGCYELYARIVPAFLSALRAEGIQPGGGGYRAESTAENKVLVFFAHGGSLGVMLSFLLGMRPYPLSAFSFQPGGICTAEFQKRQGIWYPALRFDTPCETETIQQGN